MSQHFVPVATTDFSTTTEVAASTTLVLLLNSNASRAAAAIYNQSKYPLWIHFGATAPALCRISPGGFYEFDPPVFTGAVYGVWSVAEGRATITERGS